ncbi:hypothetical protein [Rhizobium glycinendophyticum]|uniref:Uncharacterized protein n=1 Tax=Rhizobium glycinendophyticum TaxID=2589807 RepID=A0A504U8I9_9HYPH|nr:hypothetical protein [Rhizobium glycinendophyticum]TPP09787.1 hypothetical protein FJQ55_02595 [Rhizobium glycinendophyticum]
MPRRKHDPRTVYTVVFYDEAGEVVLSETRKAYGPEDVSFYAYHNMPLGAVRYEAFDEVLEVLQMTHDMTVSLRTLLKQHGVPSVFSP